MPPRRWAAWPSDRQAIVFARSRDGKTASSRMANDLPIAWSLAPAGRAGAVVAVVELPLILHANAAGAGRRRHPALLVRYEAAVPAASAHVLNTPRTIGRGDARAQVDYGGRAKDDNGNSSADGRHG